VSVFFMDAVVCVCVCVYVCVCAMTECASLFRPTHPFCVPTDLYNFSHMWLMKEPLPPNPMPVATAACLNANDYQKKSLCKI